MSSSNHSTEHTASVESLTEVFSCFICMEKLRDARLCPHCSKLCCYPCIRRWLNDQHQQCPHCRATLRLHDLVNCRWAEEVTIQLDSLKINEISQQKHEDKEKCELHKEKLSVFCSTCSKCICHQCALFNSSHTGHQFLPLDDVYKANMSAVNEHIGQLKRRHVELICSIQDIERNAENVKIAKGESLRETQNAMHAIQAKLDEQFKIRLDALNAQRLQFSRETELIEDVLQDVEHSISTSSKADVIGKQQDLLNSIQVIYRKPMASFAVTPVSCDFPSDIVPPYESSTFVITNFSIHQHNVDPIYSQPLHTNGLTWRLKVYPDGNGTVRGIYLSVFVELTHGLHESSKYEYRIEMIHQLSTDSSKNITREFASDFEVGECWGYNKFFLLDSLRTEGFLTTNNDTLLLRFQVRSPTFEQKSRDQKWHIIHLQDNNHQLNNQINCLRKELLSVMSIKRRSSTSVEKNDNEEVISTAPNANNRDEQSIAQTAIDVTEMNDDDDDDYTSLESDASEQIDSDDDENALAETDVDKSRNRNIPAVSHQSISTEQIPHQRSSHRLDEMTTIRQTASAAAKSNSVTTNPVPINLLSVDTDDEMQCAFDAWKYESSALLTDEDFLLADILERSVNDDETVFSPSNDNQSNMSSLFRPISPHNTNESSVISSEYLSYPPPEYHTILNHLMLLNPQQRTHHDRYYQRGTVPTVLTNDQQKSEQNNNPKK